MAINGYGSGDRAARWDGVVHLREARGRGDPAADRSQGVLVDRRKEFDVMREVRKAIATALGQPVGDDDAAPRLSDP